MKQNASRSAYQQYITKHAKCDIIFYRKLSDYSSYAKQAHVLLHWNSWRIFTKSVSKQVAWQCTSNYLAMPRVFNSGRLGVNTPKNFSPYAQILRRGRHDVQIYLLLITFICL